jgi:GNAT superfamily N-acetyltransferase
MIFNIRLATIKDINKLTDLHCKSFKPEEHVPMMLGRNYVNATYKWQVLSKDAYVLVAESEDTLVGLVAVCDGAFTKAMFTACLPELFISILLKPSRVFSKMLWKRLFRRPDMAKGAEALLDYPGFAQMTIGAVEKDFRGSGVFGELIEATKEYSRKRGSKAIRAGVYKRNNSSRRVFVKSGWAELPQLETEDTIFYVAAFDESFSKEFGI